MLRIVDRVVYNGLMTTNKKPSARDRILTTAHELFYREGIRATGIDRIIAQAGVTKVTFYRHFPSKNDLILSFLDYRHERWLTWFKEALARHGNTVEAVSPALAEWLQSDDFRGCAFVNTVAELATDLPPVVDVAHSHKQDMVAVLAGLFSGCPDAQVRAESLALALDGAIVRAQYDADTSGALRALSMIAGLLAAR